jgi:hypothetical protein
MVRDARQGDREGRAEGHDGNSQNDDDHHRHHPSERLS